MHELVSHMENMHDGFTLNVFMAEIVAHLVLGTGVEQNDGSFTVP